LQARLKLRRPASKHFFHILIALGPMMVIVADSCVKHMIVFPNEVSAMYETVCTPR
jgi:hypothetical protein